MFYELVFNLLLCGKIGLGFIMNITFWMETREIKRGERERESG